jgi:transglutaminase-like putative cysteine protease
MKPIRMEAQVTMGEGNRGIGILCQILLLFVGLASYLFCNVTAMQMPIPVWSVLLIAILCFGLMILLAWYKRVFYGVLGGTAAISLIAAPITFPLFRNFAYSMEVCYNYVVYLLASQPAYSDYKDYYTIDIVDLVQYPVLMQRHFYSALILLALISAVFFALALFRRLPPIISFLVPMAAMIPLFFFGIVPHYIPFSIFLSTMIGCYAQSVIRVMKKIKQKRDKKAPKPKKQKLTTAERLQFASVNGSFGVIVTAIMLIVTLCSALLIYARPVVEVAKVRETLDSASDQALNVFFGKTYERNLHVAGYLEKDECLGLEVPKFRKLKVSTVQATTSTPIYLRYRTALDLTAQGWTVPSDEYMEELEAVMAPDFFENTLYYEYLCRTTGDPMKQRYDEIESEEFGYIKDTVTVTPRYKVSNLLGIPGGTINPNPSSNFKNLDRQGDTVLLHLDAPKDHTYSYQVTSPLLSSNEFLSKFSGTQKAYLQSRIKNLDKDPYFKNEMDYTKFVREHYSNINPNSEFAQEKLAVDLKKLAQEISGKYQSDLEKVQSIERYFRSNYTYSQARNKLVLKDGSAADSFDRINYFLFESKDNKQGYCTLFASSMTLMLRSIGIPARVVSGYYVDPEYIDIDHFQNEIYDDAYHAWVEVYFDGLGWVSFEPTPGFGVERNYYLLDLADQGAAAPEPEVEIVYTDDEIIIYDVIPDPEPQDPTEETDPTTLNTLQQPGFVQNSLFLQMLMKYIKYILLALGLVLVIVGLIVSHNLQLGSIRQNGPKEGVLAGYTVILRLMQMRGFKFFEGELLESFAERVDNLQLAPTSMEAIVPILQKALFGNVEVTEQERMAVAEFAEALDRKIFRRYFYKAPLYALILRVKPRHQSMIWKFK